MRMRPRPSACCWSRRRAFARTSSTERSEESSMKSGDVARRFDASTIFPQRDAGTRPLRRSSPLIDACEAMKRCASSDSDISSENSATAFLAPSAAFSAKLAISALLWTMTSSATKFSSPGTVRSNVSTLAERLDRAHGVPPHVRRREVAQRRVVDRPREHAQPAAATARGRPRASCGCVGGRRPPLTLAQRAARPWPRAPDPGPRPARCRRSSWRAAAAGARARAPAAVPCRERGSAPRTPRGPPGR